MSLVLRPFTDIADNYRLRCYVSDVLKGGAADGSSLSCDPVCLCPGSDAPNHPHPPLPLCSPPHRRPDVPTTLVAQSRFAVAGRGQSSSLCPSPQSLDRQPVLQDPAAPLSCWSTRRASVCVPRGCGWERGRQWELRGLSHPHCSPLRLPSLRLPTHTTQRSLSRPQHDRSRFPGLIFRRG